MRYFPFKSKQEISKSKQVCLQYKKEKKEFFLNEKLNKVPIQKSEWNMHLQ